MPFMRRLSWLRLRWPGRWPTLRQRRRMDAQAETYQLGCCAVGGDIRQYLMCLLVRQSIGAKRMPRPACAQGHTILIAWGIAPVPTAATEVRDCWLYTTYTLVSSARHRGVLANAAAQAANFTAAVRFLVTLDPRTSRALYETRSARLPPSGRHRESASRCQGWRRSVFLAFFARPRCRLPELSCGIVSCVLVLVAVCRTVELAEDVAASAVSRLSASVS